MENKQKLRLEWIDPATLGENPRNWRRHPAEQIAALDEVLGDVGWAGVLLFNERTGRLIDGHARRKTWIAKHPGSAAPVLIGDWTEEQEKKILLTLDPLAAMAAADNLQLESLIDEVQLDTLPGPLADMIEELRPDDDDDQGGDQANRSSKQKAAQDGAADPPARKDRPAPQMGPEQYKIIISCRDELQQSDLLERFNAEGIECRALIA